MNNQTLSHYRIIEKLGAGGMGEVYRAEDTTLKRQVALKILPEVFATDPERLARFQREAEVLASLNHPNIAAIHGFEEAEGKRFLVLELVEGETLAERIKKGPLPVDEALEVCRQIAEGLESAHEKGVIHRDLKPANVKITPEGKVKVLDFGLAKAFQEEPAVADLSHSPTITEGMTREGVILGTAAYMSPEQAKGKPVDKRADIWAFGCVMYEMLTGIKPFEGESTTDVFGAIIHKEPNWELVPTNTPRSIRTLLQRCLQKKPKDRLHDSADARIEITDSLSPQSATAEVQAKQPVGMAWRWLIPIVALSTVLGASIYGLIGWYQEPRSEALVSRSWIEVAPAKQLAGNQRHEISVGFNRPSRLAFDFTADGKKIVYYGSGERVSQLFIRELDKWDGVPIPGGEGGLLPFLSPDDQSIAYWVRVREGLALKKLPIDGGDAVTICEIPGVTFGASWGANLIVYSEGRRLWKVAATGGEPEAITTPDIDGGERGHFAPHFLPDGEAVLFTVATSTNRWDIPRIEVLSLATGERSILIGEGADARYVPTGHLVFLRRGMLFAAPFDLSRLEVTGDVVSVMDDVMQSTNALNAFLQTYIGQFDFSDSGSLVYVAGGPYPDPQRKVVWLSRTGEAKPLISTSGPYSVVRLSPDGNRLAYSTSGRNREIYVYDILRGSSTRLTSGGVNNWPIWTPDGQKVAYALTEKTGGGKIFLTAADGSGESECLLESDLSLLPSSFSPNGELLAYVKNTQTAFHDIWVLQMADRKTEALIKTEYSESSPHFSPDGRWLAYDSNKSGRLEVYVRPFPKSGSEVIISTNSGRCNAWSPNGNELFYIQGDNIWAVDMLPKPGTPRLLFNYRELNSVFGGNNRLYDIRHGGKQIVAIRNIEQDFDGVNKIKIVQNWFEELKRLAPTK